MNPALTRPTRSGPTAARSECSSGTPPGRGTGRGRGRGRRRPGTRCGRTQRVARLSDGLHLICFAEQTGRTVATGAVAGLGLAGGLLAELVLGGYAFLDNGLLYPAAGSVAPEDRPVWEVLQAVCGQRQPQAVRRRPGPIPTDRLQRRGVAGNPVGQPAARRCADAPAGRGAGRAGAGERPTRARALGCRARARLRSRRPTAPSPARTVGGGGGAHRGRGRPARADPPTRVVAAHTHDSPAARFRFGGV